MGSEENLRIYTMPAIEKRIQELLKRRVSANFEGVFTERTAEKLVKYKELRKERQKLLGPVHYNVLEIIGFILNVDPNILEDGILDKEEYVDNFISFFAENGRQTVIIQYQPMGPPPFESGRWSNKLAKDSSIVRCCVTDGTTEGLFGQSVILYRLRNDINFEMKHLHHDVFFGYHETSDDNSGVLTGIYKLLSDLIEPSLEINTDWGDLMKKEIGVKIKNNFIGDFKDFSEFLKTLITDLNSILKLDSTNEIYHKYLSSMEVLIESAKNYDAIVAVEECVNSWIKLMEEMLVESDQLRRESEDVGPTAELFYWRGILTRFSSAVDFIKCPETQMFIALLIQARSHLVEKWKKVDDDITKVEILAQDNVRYLYALEKFTRPLYRLDPTKMGDHLPGLMQAIHMVYKISRFFNSPSSIAAFFIKITNQMILNCKSYLTNSGTLSIWQEDKNLLISRMKDCIKLYEKYYECFQTMIKNIRASDDENFKISEMIVFGKFDKFKIRLNKLIHIFEINMQHQVFQYSTIEGMNEYTKKLLGFYNKVASKSYEPLDFRKPYFDDDYEEFEKYVSETEFEMRNFFFKTVSIAPNIDEALQLVQRFEKLGCERLWIDRKYLELVTMFQKEIETIRDIYNEERSSPPLPTNIPPVAGRILWIRQLHKRVEKPMDIFKKRDKVMTHETMQKCVKIYNALIRVFVHYEVLYHKAWFDSVEVVRLALASPLLVQHPQTNDYVLNFDPYIDEVIREAEYMLKFGYEIPEFIRIITFCKEKIINSREVVKKLVEDNNEVRNSVPKLFVNLMKPGFNKLELSFKPCLSIITWTSLKIFDVCNDIKKVIEDVKLFIKRLIDLKDARIEDVLDTISDTKLIQLNNYSTSSSVFLADNLKFQQTISNELQIKSSSIENTVLTIIYRCLKLIKEPELQEEKFHWFDEERLKKQIGSQISLSKESINSTNLEENVEYQLNRIHNDCMDVFSYFHNQFIQSLVNCTKYSLDLFKKRLGGFGVVMEEDTKADDTPLFLIDFVLQIPTIIMSPSIEQLNLDVKNIVENIIGIHRGISMWGQKTPVKKRTSLFQTEGDLDARKNSQKDYYDIIAGHKQVSFSPMSFQAAILVLKNDIKTLRNSYIKRFSYIWSEDKNNEIQKLIDTNPDIHKIREEFCSFDNLIIEIKNLPKSHVVGPLEISIEKLKLGLLVEIENWKRMFGSILSKTYSLKLKQMKEYINDKNKILGREIKDLEDVRVEMKCLDEIRDDFISLDCELIKIEETYNLMSKFNVTVLVEDQNTVDSLRYNFSNMLQKAKQVQQIICEMQEPLKTELIDGIAVLTQDVEKFDMDFEVRGPMEEGIPASEANERLILAQSRYDELNDRYRTYSSAEALFGLEVTEYPILRQRKKEMTLLQKLYGLYSQVMRTIDQYYEILWSEIDIDSIITELSDLQNKCRKLPKGMKDWPAYIDLKKKIDDFNEICPLLELMADEAMKERHWEKISNICNYLFDVESESFTLANVIQAPLLKYKDDIEDICITAVKEKEIEIKLKQIIAEWSVVDLKFSTFKQRGELLLKGDETLEIINQLEDSFMIISSLIANRYNAFFKKDIQLWQNKLSNTLEILAKWLNVQNLWAYLEAVFIGGDIAKQLPSEARRFNNIDKSWVKLMYRAREKVKAVETCTGDDTMNRFLPHLLEQLESCQKSLSGYLETKRAIFPRFCFISDPTLLEILGQAADSHTIQNYLDGLFDNLDKLDFSEKEYDKIVAMYSREGEKVVLESEVSCSGGVEHWLNSFLDMHQQSVRGVLSQGLQSLASSDFNILTLIDESILQVGLLALQVLWTRDSEAALISARRDRTIMKKTNQSFIDLLNNLIEKTVLDLTSYQRAKYEALITIHVHQRDIFDELYRSKVRNNRDFEWLKQARFYYEEEEEEIDIKITDVNFTYQNEFLGCTDRLVITPLTDRCYITLAQAVGMNFGGAPAGPAGTGKTETTKDMGKTLGKYVIVFNCSDQMDFRGLGRIFKGLAQAGVWGCFDEFNRIELPVLSVAAQQIAIVLTARKEKRTHFLFSDGETYPINSELGIFITMNPGYAGRQELPENLKTLFRNVAMMIPDRQIIIRVKMAACGFKDNVILARKFFTLYRLCEEQLSKQVHYDFGLRNILSCLRTLGAQKRANPDESEETTLMRVLRGMNLSKLVDEDEPLFLSLIEDMFPGIKITSQTYKDLQREIEKVTDYLGIINHSEWNLKVIQLYETSLVRHGLMVLGPTGSGKTQCMITLMKALTEMGKPHKEIRMNPKAITSAQMFGKLDVATNDWTDGIFSTIWRRSTNLKKNEYLWIVLDGPVDAVWIENLNSVLDDNKTLTLANGDRIIMAANCKLVFEPDNIDNASPATVSRMGMVFMSSSVLKWDSILESWLKTRDTHEAKILRELFNKIYDDAMTFVQTKLPTKMILLDALYIKQCINLLTGLLSSEDSSLKTFIDSHVEKIFLFSLMWSLGALLELNERNLLQEYFLNHSSSFNWPKLKEDETIFEYLVTENGEWIHWEQMIPIFEYPEDRVLEYSTILVPNVDNTRTLYLVDIIAKQEKAVLLIGEQGTAKTVMIKTFMSQYDVDYHLSKSINFSSASTPNMIQRIFESFVEKRVGHTFGPPGGKKLTVFIDDINMPDINDWGDQITNEIVRQMMEYNGFYSLDKPGEFNIIQDVQLLAAMIHPGGGRNDIPSRLKRQFNIFNCTLPSNNSIDKIFGSIGQGYFNINRFNVEIVKFLPKLVPLTRILWQEIKIKMLPTPAKFHYIFNLRDLSRIWEGILRIQTNECYSPQSLLKLWDHECTRVISDRFVSLEDKIWFRNKMEETVEKVLQNDKHYYQPEETYFVNFLREPPEPTGYEPDDFVFEAPKIYEEIPNYEIVLTKVKQNMEQFNELIRGMKLDLVFFHDALVHLMRISRILGVPRGNAMLVGVGGSGKKSLTRLASFIAGYKFFEIVLTRSYNVTSLLEDIRKLYRETGMANKGQTFIFTDNEIKDESFLEYFNNILSVGEIANLFTKDELDEIFTILTPIMKKDEPKTPPTLDNLYNYFISRVKNNLHIVLCFSPVGEKFRLRSLKFPALVSGCTINWFERWPRDALSAVSHHFLSNYELKCSNDIKESIIKIMGDIQDNVNNVCEDYFTRFRRRCYVTPKSFLCFIDAYKTLYKQRLDEINTLAYSMSYGLNKLVDAASQVDDLKIILEKNREEIAVKNVQVEEILKIVNEKKTDAEAVKAEVQKSKDEAEKLLKIISKEKAIAEDKLKAAEPVLLEAEAALQTIKAADISTVRKLAKPPYLITLIMDCVIILFGRKLDPVKPDYEHQFLESSWPEALRVMADTRFLYHLQDFPKDNINGEMIDLMLPYLNYPTYNYESAKQVCGNVAGLIQWTIAMTDFYQVNKDVLPLKTNLAVQQSKHNQALKNLQVAQVILDEKDEALKVVQSEFNGVMVEYQEIVDQAENCEKKLDTAGALIEGLSGERNRWTNQLSLFKSEIDRLVGDVLVLTAFLSYCGPFNQLFRGLLQTHWCEILFEKKIPVTMSVNVIDCLTDSSITGEWNLQGLPNDELSIQNGIIVTKATRYPLLIDPQLQGKTWIKNKEKQFDLQITNLNHKYFRNHLEDCVSIGKPLLIEDVYDELDPVLNNLLDKNWIQMGKTLKVKLGDKDVDIHPSFRLYITTKSPNPYYSPEIFARASIIDFTVTMKGLEDQLLGRVIVTEKRELETERTQLMTDVTMNKKRMKELEANLLQKLTTVQGSLIEDVELMSVLNKTRQTADDVTKKLNIARNTEIEINNIREEFRPVAARGSVLYFLICDMAHVNCMYQTSLVQFLERFDLSMARSEKSPVNSRRINYIIEYLTYEIFKYKSRGLYKNHKYMFILLMGLKIDLQRGSITFDEFQYFIKGGAALDLNSVRSKPFKWISDMTWLNLVALSSLNQFQSILNAIETSEKSWKNWYDKETPEEEIIPDGYQQLDVFRRLLIIRAWCTDRTLSQSQKYIANSLGSKYTEPVITLLDVVLAESRPNTPMICLLSMGSDPTTSIHQLAKKMEIQCRSISMGQGQEIHAKRLLNNAKNEGFWVLLQNCHLGLNYMNELIDFILEMGSLDSNFRIWITTEVHEAFPISLLQMSIKFTYEPPQGIKAGLQSTYSNMHQEMLDQCDSGQYIPLVYAISFLHSVVQERRKFGPLGWNIPYEFNSADWLASCLFINNHLNNFDPKRGISWQTIRYMVGEVQYGGRVTDDYDKRLLNTFAKIWLSESIFNDDFSFYDVDYKVLNLKQVSDYLAAFEYLPSDDPPQLYGLHSNAGITYQSRTTQEVFDTIISIQPKESTDVGSGESREINVLKQAQEMLDKLPLDYDQFAVRGRLRTMGINQPMNIFLKQEIDRMQIVIKLVRFTLKELILAIEGVIIMNEQLKDAFDNIYDARIPKVWRSNSWESTTLGFWFTELLERNQQFSDWISKGRPIKFWMTGFFNPQGFLTAMKQEMTRANKGWALDSVSLHNEVMKQMPEEVKTCPNDGVYVYGLFLEGAGWDRRNNKLRESLKKVLYVEMPVIHIFAQYNKPEKDPKLYQCPLYKKPSRTYNQLITPLWLPTLKSSEFWILRGVALLCDNK